MTTKEELAGPLFRCRGLNEFNRLFLRLPEIRLYLVLFAAAAVAALWLAASVWDILLPTLAVAMVYPAYEYVLHRWVLHFAELCRNRLTARLWWRLHYRHHSMPQDASVILGAPPTVIAAAVLGAALVAAPFGSYAAFATALAAALAAAILYEYFHSLAHSQVKLTNRYLGRMRRHHLTHHHISDKHNYGIVTDAIDRFAGTTVAAGDGFGRSDTTYNLGYTDTVAAEYPWLQEYDGQQARRSP